MIVYSLYTGVATKMFIFFKCVKIKDHGQDQHYLAADYRINCHDTEYKQYQTLAVLGIVFYVFGLLGGILGLLFYNKPYLHASKCPDDMLYKHVTIQKQLGSVYGDCKWTSFFFRFWLDVYQVLIFISFSFTTHEQTLKTIFILIWWIWPDVCY